MPRLQKITPCLWFDSEAEEAARFYVSIFRNARIGDISHYGKEGFETHGRPEGSVAWLILTVIIGAHLAAGAMWIAMLAFSEYLARVHEQVLGRPLYVVSDSSEDLRARIAAQPAEAAVEPGREAA